MVSANLYEDLLDQYKIEQYIAERRYTELYLAYDVDEDRPISLEILRRAFLSENGFADRLAGRATAVSQVRHPNIARVYQVGRTPDGAPYVAQAYVEGRSLAERLEQLQSQGTPVNSIYALKLMRQLADALSLAERLGLYHHDLQPESVLLRTVALPSEDVVVLGDLFVPDLRETRSSADDADEERKKYLSPEQLAGRDIDGRSHVYSVGAMLYRLLAGEAPPGPITQRDVYLNRIAAWPTALERVRADLAPRTYQVVERCLRRDPRRRFRNTNQLIKALDEAIVAEELLVGSPRDERKPASPSVGLPVLLALVVLILIAGSAFLLLDTRAAGRGSTTPTTVAMSSDGAAFTDGMLGAEAAQTLTLTPTSTAAVIAATTGADLPPLSAVSQSTIPARGSVAPPPEAEPSVTSTVSPTETPSVRPSDTPTPTARATDTATPRVPVVRVAYNAVNLRRGPGVDFPTAGYALRDEALLVLARNDAIEDVWYLVLTGDGRVGWISSTMILTEDLGPPDVPVAATLPPTPTPTPTFTPTPSPTATATGTIEPPEGQPPVDDGDGSPQPTSAPTDIPPEPTLTPPPLP